jgi:CRISPR-associated protein Csb2
MGVVSRLWLVPGLGGGGLKMALEHLSIAGFLEAVEPVSFTEIAGERVGWSSFRRVRNSGYGRGAVSAGYGFRIEFPAPVRGPVTLGYGAHFGMGGFEAEKK